MSSNTSNIIPKVLERNSCPVCKSSKNKLLFDSRINVKSLKLLEKVYKYKKNKDNLKIFLEYPICICKCDSCELIYHKKIPDQKTLNYIYSVLIDQKESYKKHKANEIRKFSKSIKLLNRLGAIIKDKSVGELNYLDFGFGWGNMLRASQKLGFNNSYGIEQNSLQLELIKKKNIIVYDSIEKFLQSDHRNILFSIITLNQVLEHVLEPIDILRELRKISKRKCILYIAIPEYHKANKVSNHDVFKKGPLQPFEHLNCFSKKSIIYLANETNWILLTFKNLVKNIFFIYKRYNISLIIIILISLIKNKGAYYLIPK